MPLLWNLALSILTFCKVFVFSRENYMLSPVLSVLRVTKMSSHIHSTLIIYKKKLMVGVISLTHIPIDNLLRTYIYSPRYIWAQGSIFFSFMHHVYISIQWRKICKEKNALACARILILKISQNQFCDISIEIVILHRLEPS